jgi:hypothetical protein
MSLRDTWMTLGPEAAEIAAQAGFAAELANLTESPIETIFGVAAAKMLLQHYRDDFAVCLPADEAGYPDARALMMPQYPFLRYRMDWAFRFKNRHHPLVFVECDGAEFHSTPEQIANDRAKDQAAAAADIMLLRFTGSDIVSARSHCITRFKMRIAPNWRMP